MPDSDAKDPPVLPWIFYTFDHDGTRWRDQYKLHMNGSLALRTKPEEQRIVFDFDNKAKFILQIETEFLINAWNDAVSTEGSYTVGATKVDGEHVLGMRKPDGKLVYFRAYFENDGESPFVEILGRPRDAPRDMKL